MVGIDGLYKLFKKLWDRAFGLVGNFIVNSSTSLSGGVYSTMTVLEDVTGFTCTDAKLITGSAAHPTDLSAGVTLYGEFTAASVSTGTIKFYSK